MQPTPACTDYNVDKLKVKKKEPGFADMRTVRFYHHKKTVEEVCERPHSYEDPDNRGVKKNKSGSFGRAVRF